jgi:hypothetical protein
MAALGCFWHPQIMPDFSLPKTSIKPYQNRPRGLMNVLFLPTLKPEEPKKFRPLVRSKVALMDPPREKSVVFIAPKLVAQISFQEWTADRKLRQPVFLGLRNDKSAQDVLLPGSTV